MTIKEKRLCTFAKTGETLETVIKRMSTESKEVVFPGLIVVNDEQEVLKGILTDGDIR